MPSSTGETSASASAGPLRIEAWAGEIRVNVIRLVGIVAFYAHHLIQMALHRSTLSANDRRYNVGVTLVVIAWAGMTAGLHVLLTRRRWTPGMKFVVVLADLALVAAIGILSGGPRTPLIALFFVVIASAPLRMSLPLVYVATFGAWIGYLVVCAYYAWVKIGYDLYYATPSLQISRTHEIIMLLALGATGLLAGQSVRQARRLVQGYPAAVVPSESAEGR